MSKVMQWVDEELARDATLARKVEAELARLRVEQDLVALRERQGLSQRELARRVGVSQPVIARIEACRARNLALRTLLRIASVLNGEVRFAFAPALVGHVPTRGVGPPKPPPPPADTQRTA